ncbi:hypothetical protein [Pseudonocardia sp. T1-2H]|uniref:hypothetical protein n=1 Tax=Pseudonocardia sp. T1-2H TaxID=3128899 RepID=UPI0031014812
MCTPRCGGCTRWSPDGPHANLVQEPRGRRRPRRTPPGRQALGAAGSRVADAEGDAMAVTVDQHENVAGP